MSFISINFALFVAVWLLVYYIVRPKYRYLILLAASILFYALTGLSNLLFILFTTVSTYFCAIGIEEYGVKSKEYIQNNKDILTKEAKKEYKNGIKKKQKRILAINLILNFGILFFMKYANISIAYFNMYRLNLTGNTNFVPFLDIILPLGISFYIFQSMGYVLDVYYGKIKATRDFLKFALFVSFFPQIVQGPISRFNDLYPNLTNEIRFDFNNIKSGFYLVMWGLFKKLIIADRISPFVTRTMDFAEYYKGPYILIGVFFYSFQIYSDFSGGIDIAIGVAKMFGIDVTANFERPFFSKSISEYWRRWHITLGTWFKDYIFYPLSINKSILKLARWFKAHKMEKLGKRIPIYLPMIAVWALTGMWHGSESRYVVWGLFNCLFIILGTELEPVSLKIMEKFSLREDMFIVKSYRIIKTFWLMSFLRLFDITKDVNTAFMTFKSIFKEWGAFEFVHFQDWYFLETEDLIITIVAIVILFTVSMIQRKGSIRERLFTKPVWLQWIVLSVLILAVFLFGSYGIGYEASSFVYMQF